MSARLVQSWAKIDHLEKMGVRTNQLTHRDEMKFCFICCLDNKYARYRGPWTFRGVRTNEIFQSTIEKNRLMDGVYEQLPECRTAVPFQCGWGSECDCNIVDFEPMCAATDCHYAVAVSRHLAGVYVSRVFLFDVDKIDRVDRVVARDNDRREHVRVHLTSDQSSVRLYELVVDGGRYQETVTWSRWLLKQAIIESSRRIKGWSTLRQLSLKGIMASAYVVRGAWHSPRKIRRHHYMMVILWMHQFVSVGRCDPLYLREEGFLRGLPRIRALWCAMSRMVPHTMELQNVACVFFFNRICVKIFPPWPWLRILPLVSAPANSNISIRKKVSTDIRKGFNFNLEKPLHVTWVPRGPRRRTMICQHPMAGGCVRVCVCSFLRGNCPFTFQFKVQNEIGSHRGRRMICFHCKCGRAFLSKKNRRAECCAKQKTCPKLCSIAFLESYGLSRGISDMRTHPSWGRTL